jgi:hypothetical protein
MVILLCCSTFCIEGGFSNLAPYIVVYGSASRAAMALTFFTVCACHRPLFSVATPRALSLAGVRLEAH